MFHTIVGTIAIFCVFVYIVLVWYLFVKLDERGEIERDIFCWGGVILIALLTIVSIQEHEYWIALQSNVQQEIQDGRFLYTDDLGHIVTPSLQNGSVKVLYNERTGAFRFE